MPEPGLSGGALASADAVLVVLTRLNRIVAVEPLNRRAVVEPGVVNLKLSAAVLPLGLHYAPDPSSQSACTVGGNVAENAGGPHCLKYGVTTNHILALEVVLADGSVVELGSPAGDAWGPDLVGGICRVRGQLRHRHQDHRQTHPSLAPSAPCWPISSPCAPPEKPSPASSRVGSSPPHWR